MRSATLLRWTLVASAIAILELACRLGWLKATTIVAPTVMARRLVQLGGQGAFWHEMGSTFHNVLWAFGISLLVGAAFAVLLHALPRLRRAIEPLITSYYALPFYAFYPLAIVMLGMNSIPIILMGAMFGIMAMTSSTLDGLDRLPRVLAKVADSYRLGPMRSATLIQFPAAIPYLFSGAKLALGYSISGVIGSEFILSSEGLGYSISFAYNNFDTPTMYALLMFLLIVVSLLIVIFNTLERRMQYRAAANWTVLSGPRDAGGRTDRFVAVIVVAASALFIWQWLYAVAGREAIASPEMTLRRLWELGHTRLFWDHVRESGRALGLALVMSIAIGSIVGVALGTNGLARRVFEPFLVALQSTPKVTLYPVMLLVFGLGIAAKVAFGAIHGVVPMALLVIAAIRSINPALLRTAKAFRLDRLRTITTVLFPAVLPEAVTAVRLSFSVTFLGVLIGEMFASQKGLGFLLMSSIGLNDVATIMAVTVVLAVAAITGNSLLLAIDNRLPR